ncbi:MAG: class I SAM-dependent methyltransferase [Kofleriaceae bacterium]
MHEQADYWNGKAGERWVKSQRDIDRSMAAITELWLPWVAPRSNETALDIGCGTGTTTVLLKERCASVTGVDISKPMLALARERVPGVTFVEADAATAKLDRYDLLASRFGVMFFDDPIAAFKNLHATGGRIAFVCWRDFTENDWAYKPFHAVQDLLPSNHVPVPREPGPFAFADRTYLESILVGAGFHDIEITAAESTMLLGDTVGDAVKSVLTFGPLSRAIHELPDAVKAEAQGRLPAVFATTTAPRAAIWLVRARP